MNQPDLGLKVAELRQQKGLTQEQLAALCEVSPRTIQRIESGEVDPRAYTLHCLRTALDFDFGEESTENENLWLTILHLSSIICLLVIPLVLWSWKKNQSYKIDQQGRLVLNFQITMTLVMFAGLLYMFIAAPLLYLFVLIKGGEQYFLLAMFLMLFSLVPFLFVGLFCLIQGILNTVRAMADKPVHYALSIPFVK